MCAHYNEIQTLFGAHMYNTQPTSSCEQWWPEACKGFSHQYLLHIWTSWDLSQWTVGYCVWWQLEFSKFWCSLSTAGIPWCCSSNQLWHKHQSWV